MHVRKRQNLKIEQIYFKPVNRTKMFHSIKAGIFSRCYKGSVTALALHELKPSFFDALPMG